MPERLRVFVLGPLQVRRGDGSVIAIDEWRTGKTRDLLRLLALADGRPVPPELLVEKLWPDVRDERSRRNRLRTATSQIRRTVGSPCVARQADGLVLARVWVDALQFLADARRVHEAARTAQHDLVVTLTLEAEALHRGDFRAYDDDAPWVRAVRHDLVVARQQMACDAATSALALPRNAEALDMAALAVRLDPSSETAQRLLMRAHARLGEFGTALRVFEAYRVHLAVELGATPSPETRDLHLHLLRQLDT